MFTLIQNWFWEIQSLTVHKYHTLSPRDYAVMLVVCGVIGLTLLCSRRR